ncbi:universal stress protein [Cellulosimicrobium terreum]|nr:universal stress protein [Cellulosimicrobium terreum]
MSTPDPRVIARLRTRLPARDEPAGTVLVAFDASRASRGPLQWAAAEATARGDALRVVRAVTAPVAYMDPWTPWHVWFPWAAADGPDQGDLVWTAARKDLATAVLQAHSVDPLLPVDVALRPGPVSAAVLHEAHDHTLLVVAKRRRARRLPGARPSAAWGTVRRSPVPVAVVELADTPETGPSTGRVVVALRGRGDPTPVLETAFRSARRRRTGLTLLHSWDRGVLSEVVGEMLDPHRLVFPEVDVRYRRVDSLVRAVVAESKGAAVTVVGAPTSWADVAGRVLRRRLVGAVHGPVVLVPPARPTPDEQVPS